MPSEHRRRKDDTWTPDELNKALKGGSKDDRRRGDGDRRHHGEDSDRRRHRDEGDEKKGRRHKERGESPEVQLTEEERERLRRERREKREKGKEPRPKQKEMRPEKAVRIDDGDDEDDRRRRHHRRDEDERKERKSHKGEEESRGHRDRDDRHKESRHHDRDKDNERERRHHDDDERRRKKEKESSSSSRHHKDNDDDDERRRRHREKESSSRRHHDEDEDRHRRHRDDEKHASSRRHHRDEETHDDNDRQRRHHNGSDRRRHKDEDEGDEEKERQRQERRERREREKQKEKEKDRDKDRHRDDRDRRSEKTSDRHREHRKDKDEYDDGERSSKQKSSASTPSISVNGKHGQEEEEKQADDDYNYEEDFEDYEDDFEDEEDPEMKEALAYTHDYESPSRMGYFVNIEDGEMEEVLRALDEENNRLQSNSRRSNWSDSTELSDERFKDHREEEERKPKNVSRGKSFINFISAKQRVMDSTVASKARKRFTDLSKLIELDVARYDMFDLPPVGEYELYIRNFGRSDTKQAYVQTGDDDIEREVQTEEIESLSKWTQHPSEQDADVGGEGIAVVTSGESGQGPLASDSERLQKFLDRVGKFLFTILDEESISSNEEERKRDATPSASFSQSTYKLGFPDFLEGRQVKALSFCPSDPNSLLSIHSLPHERAKEEKASVFESLYLLCIWNLSQMAYPFRICVSEMMITCACFSPTKASLVFAGMYDGSVSLWDLREPAAQHKTLQHKDDDHVVRYPTYMTAGVLEAENHKSPVKAITAVHSSIVGSLRDDQTAESSSGLSFQLASVEEKSAVNLWVVAEIPVPDPAGSEHDLGLSPGGKIKLIRSSIILLNNPNKYLSFSQEIKALDVQLNPADLNHLYVTTDAGCVVHGVRFGKRAYPPAYSPLVASPVPLVSMDFSPFGQPYFLTACQDGTLYLFHIRSEHPIAIWREFISGETILSVRWSRSRPAVFFVLDNNSNILTFDLVENGLTPIKTDNIRSADATCMEIGSDPELLTPGVSRPAQMAFALDNGTIECLSVSDQMRKQQPLEEDFLASYIDRY